MRLQEFPGTSDPALASGITKNLTYHRNLLHDNNEHLTNIYRVKTRRRRAKCGLIPSFQGSGRNSFKASSYPLFSASSEPPKRGKAGVRQSFGRGIWATDRRKLMTQNPKPET